MNIDNGASTGDEDLSTSVDLDSIISGAMAGAGYDVPADAAPAASTAEVTTPDASAQGQTRDPSGRFSSAAAAPASADPAAAPSTPASTTAQPPVAPATLEAPARWSDADKTAFKTLAPDAQRMLLDRHSAMEADYTRKSQDLAAFRQSAEPLVSAIQPHAEYLAGLGLRPDQAVGQLLMAERSLRLGSPEQKAQALAGLAGQYGIDLRALAAGTRPDPVASQLHQQGQQLDQRLRSIETAHRQEQARQAQVAHDGALSQVAAFQAEQNTDGTPKYPHFEAVRGTMQQLFQTGQATDLSSAYAMAAAPIEAAVAAERARVEAAAGAQRQQQVDRARRAAPGIPTQGTNPGRAQPQGLDDIVRNALASAGLPTI